MTRCLMVLGVLACACTSGSRVSGTKEQREVLAYRHELTLLSVFEREAVEAMNAVMGETYRSDAVLLEALRARALPQYRRYVDGLSAILPENEELLSWHQKLRKLAEREWALLTRLERALGTRAGTMLLLVNQEQRQLRVEMDALLGEFDALTARHDPAVALPRATR